MKNFLKFLFSLSLCIWPITISAGQVYQWIDDDGVLRISDSPTEIKSNADIKVFEEIKRAPVSYQETINQPQNQPSHPTIEIEPQAHESSHRRNRINKSKRLHQQTINSLEFERNTRREELESMVNSRANRTDYKSRRRLAEQAKRQQERIDEVSARINAEKMRHYQELERLMR